MATGRMIKPYTCENSLWSAKAKMATEIEESVTDMLSQAKNVLSFAKKTWQGRDRGEVARAPRSCPWKGIAGHHQGDGGAIHARTFTQAPTLGSTLTGALRTLRAPGAEGLPSESWSPENLPFENGHQFPKSAVEGK